jgi:di/tricarboxylate transporter
MSISAWTTVGVIGAVFAALAFTSIAPDIALVGALGFLLVTGILAPGDALVGFANEGMITVGVLFVIGAGVRETGGVDIIANRLFGRPKSASGAVTRLMLPVAALSAFMNNTPLVAMLIPAVNDWARQLRIAASKVMMPLSFAAILGGTCTLIGTSTNLVVNGLVISAAANEEQALGKTDLPHGLGMFDITWVGLPSALAGCAYVIFVSRWLLPDRRPAISRHDDPREYTVEMLVAPDSPLVGKTIEDAGLRHLEGVYLAEIDRAGTIMPAVSSLERLRANDRLVFVGIVDSVVEMRRIRGLVPATDQVFKLVSPTGERTLVEAVVSDTCPVAGRTIRDGRFRSIYNAAVIAVARNGERLRQKIGDIVLTPGDTLLLECHPSFAEQQRNSRDFYLVSAIENSNPPHHERAALAIGILLCMVIAVTLAETEWFATIPNRVAALGPVVRAIASLSMLKAAVIAAAAMLVTGCVTIGSARRSIDWSVLVAIAASFGLGAALEKTGAAKVIGSAIIDVSGGSPWYALAMLYVVTVIVTELITNNAAAALMFPFALATARNLDANPMSFIIVIMMAASAGFATPIGYQTNLMVYGPGGYRFSDYVKMGVPLDLLIGIITVLIAPWVWPFHS